MGILDFFGKKDVAKDLKRVPYKIKVEFIPFKLNANTKSSVIAEVTVKNELEEPALTSIVVEVPKQLGLDETTLSKTKEIKLGELAPGEEKKVKCEIFGSAGTDKGEYTITFNVFAHYRDYNYVLNQVRKKETLRVE